MLLLYLQIETRQAYDKGTVVTLNLWPFFLGIQKSPGTDLIILLIVLFVPIFTCNGI